jgi:hypothetical protein
MNRNITNLMMELRKDPSEKEAASMEAVSTEAGRERIQPTSRGV